ncbi:enoyl-CoA hydratase-related protein [Aeromicrobium sp. P5_D10]
MEHVRYAVEGHVAVITLDRPDRLNAFTDTMERELIECFDRSDADDEVRVVVLTGAGRAFCAGMDLAETDPRDTFTSWRASASAPAGTQFDVDGSDLPVRRDGGGRVVLRIFDSLKPVISAINGHAVGVGATMTLPTDLRLGADGAKFSFPFVQRAFVPESCSSWFLPRVVPVQVATEWMLTGRTFDAAEALRGGLLRSTHPAEDVLPTAMELAHEIAESTSAVSASATRRMLWAMLTASHPMRAHEIETLALNDRGVSADAREGVAAFVEKRRPTFGDRVSSDSPAVLDTLVRPAYTPPGDPR